jgi:hypothetical protein
MEQFGEEVLPKFPPKITIFDSISKPSETLLQERKTQLENYIQQICLNPQLFQSACARSFLEPDSPKKVPFFVGRLC